MMAALLGVMLTTGGCGLFGPKGEEELETGKALVKPGKPVPTYAEMARRYNERVEPLHKLFGRANIRLSYFDEHGEKKTEEPEGRLQVVRPDKLALSLGKAGQIMFWFGCDSEKYWWFDLSESDKRVLAFGRHDLYTEQIGQRIGIALRPLDLIRVLGIVPLDPDAPGATQWSRDGARIGVTTALTTGPGSGAASRGFQRIWINPSDDMPVSIEIYDPQKKLILTATHTGQEPIELETGRYRPPMAAQILVDHLPSKTQARLTLTGLKDSGVSSKAFDLTTLLDKYPVDRQIDLDKKAEKAADKAVEKGAEKGVVPAAMAKPVAPPVPKQDKK